ncbi:MAG: serine kinase [Odoribacteraceae bacterium]|jgi:serine kinase of HPr protein (carbohydrate metabolism regulator)|nr:serine kinase [Odoribacteraceae bacterium]
MQVKEIMQALSLTPCSGHQGLDREITGGYVSDLLSDVMGHAREGEAWITLQAHKNIMAIASLKELAAIILVKGRRPDEDTASASDSEGIPILSTPLDAFETSGKLYQLLASPSGESLP